MSYILDALRKSEHERQVAAGQSVGMLHPIVIQRDHKLWLPISIVVLVTMMVCALIAWWMWSPPLAESKTVPPISTPTVAVVVAPPAATLPAVSSETITEQSLPTVKKPISEPVQKKFRSTPLAAVQLKPIIQKEAKPVAADIPKTTSNVDPLKNLPPLRITGYIHNAVSGNLAMVNNQLVREGEEISPGLSLVKVLDDSAIFSYKGYVFSR